MLGTAKSALDISFDCFVEFLTMNEQEVVQWLQRDTCRLKMGPFNDQMMSPSADIGTKWMAIQISSNIEDIYLLYVCKVCLE